MRIRKKAVEDYRDAIEIIAMMAALFAETEVENYYLTAIVAVTRDSSALTQMDVDTRPFSQPSTAVTLTPAQVAEMREQAIAAINATIDAQGMVAQSLSMQLYDAICQAEGIESEPAQMFPDIIDREMMDDKVHYLARDLVRGDKQVFEKKVGDLAASYVRRSAFENTVRNCDANHVRYARVPADGEACDFCMMLASRDFIYHSQATAYGHGIHAHCRCVVVPGVKGRTTIEGYDPDRWAKRWEELIETLARQRAARNGTDEHTEYKHIMDKYAEAAKRAHERHGRYRYK